MPVFNYRCTDCQHEFSELVFGQEVVTCPECRSTKNQKLINSFGTISDTTKFESHASDLPSMSEFKHKKHLIDRGLPTKKLKPKKKTKDITNTKHLKKVLKKR